MRFLAIIACAALLSSCATKYNAPDNAKVVEATRKVEVSQKAAHETHALEFKSVKVAQESADALSVETVEEMKKLDVVATLQGVELQQAVTDFKVDVASRQAVELTLNENLAAAWTNSGLTETHLSETDAEIVVLKKEQANYFNKAQGLANTATKLSAKLAWYRWHWYLSWIIGIGGVVFFIVLGILWKMGKLALWGGQVAAKVETGGAL